MAITYDRAITIFNEKLQFITEDALAWSDFLRDSSKFSSYNFNNQVMILAQRHKPNFVASFEHWNNVQECRVMKGKTGIALFGRDTNRLTYVFAESDVAEIHDNTKNGHKPVAWIAADRHNAAILSKLDFMYPDLELPKDADFKDKIKNYINYATDLYFAKNEADIDGMSDEEHQFIYDSVEYSIIARLGLNPSFKDYPSFNNAPSMLDVIEEVGAINQEISQEILSEIGSLCMEYDLAHIEEIGLDSILSRKKDQYDEFIDYIENKREKENEHDTESHSGRDNISDNRGLQVSESSDRELQGNTEQIRNSEIELFGREQTFEISENVLQNDSLSSSIGDSDSLQREDGSDNERNASERESDRRDESTGTSSLGPDVQSSSEQSRGDRAARNGLRLEYTGEELKYEQLTIFALPEVEQIGNIMAEGTHSHEEKPSAFGISDEQLNTILRSGGGNENSRSRIFAKYSAHKNPSEMIGFLKNEYKTTGKGFTFDKNPVSVWFDESGMRVGYGATALESPIAHLSWEKIEDGIRNLIENGDYISEAEAYLVESSEINRLSGQIYFFFRDGMNENIEDIVNSANYPDSIISINDLLATHEGRNRLGNLISEAKDKLDSEEVTLKWKYVKSPEFLLNELADLDTTKIDYPLKNNVAEIKADFITQDEIDYGLSQGSSFSNGKFRIYEYFLEGHDKKENAEFLKHEYGIGGGSGGLPGANDSHNNHDAKGIEFAKGPYGNPYAKVLLNWNAIEKRIGTLIKEGKYFNAEGIEAYKAYKAEKNQKALEKAQLDLKIASYRACADDFEDLFQAYKGESIPQGAIEDILKRHSNESVNFVVANSILRNEGSTPAGMHFKAYEKAKELLPDRNYYESIYTKTTISFNERDNEGNYFYGEDIDLSQFVAFMDQVSSNIFEIEKEETKIQEEKATEEVFDYAVLLNNEEEVFFTGAEPKYGIWSYNDKTDIVDENGKSITFKTEEEANAYVEVLRKNKDIAYESNEKKELEAAQDGFIEKKSVSELEIGDCVSVDGKNWRITSTDSFMMSFENLDPSDITPNFSLIGHAHERLSEHDWKHIPEPNTEIRTYEKELKNKISLAESQVNELKDALFKKDEAWEEKYKLWNDAFGAVLLLNKESKEEFVGYDKVKNFINSLDISEKEISDIAKKEDYVSDLYTNDAIDLIDSVEIKETIIETVAKTHDTEPSLVAKQVEEYREANSQEEMDEWHIVHDADDENGNATQWAYKYAENSFIWIDKLEDNTYGVTDSAESDNYLFVTGMLDEAMEMGENYVIEQEIAHVQDMAEIDEAKITNDLEIEASLPTEAKNLIKAKNYQIEGHTYANGTPSERFSNNIAAIRTLKQLEEENRTATPVEQKILAKYVGWGGLANAFDERNGETEQNRTLKEILTDKEYDAAKRSTLDAFYTSPLITKEIYFALEKMGFEGGSMLEPSCGIGNFIGTMPNTLRNTTSVIGVELDSLSSRIAEKLYPEATIFNKGYENTSFNDNSFDVAIGNVPFGQIKPFDSAYEKENFFIHDYFFAKSLDKVRPGGVVAFITSTGTLDKKSEEVRRYLAERAELVGAIRLPNNAFKDAAGTVVTSDIIFLQKREEPISLNENNMPSWVHLGANEDGIEMNQYFVENPGMICGTMEMTSGPYGPISTCRPNEIIPLDVLIHSAIINNIDAKIDKSLVNLANDKPNNVLDMKVIEELTPYKYTLIDNDIYVKINNIVQKVEDTPENISRIKSLMELRDLVHEILDKQQDKDFTDEELSAMQYKLNSSYDSFVKKYKRINMRTNVKLFEDDSSLPLLKSLEIYNENKEFVAKSDIFTKRTISPVIEVTHCENAVDALSVCLNQTGSVNLNMISNLTGLSENEIIDELKGKIFLEPTENRYVTAEEYLSGDVVTKLERVNALIDEGIDNLEINKIELEKVQPEKLKASEISVRLGATWIESKYYEQFMQEVFQMPGYMFNSWYKASEAGVNMNPITNEYTVRGKWRNSLTENTYGTHRKNALTILEESLNLRDSKVYDYFEEDGKRKSVLNQQETSLALQKQEILKEKFNEWIFSDPERRDYLVEKYNSIFNRTRERSYNGEFLTFPGMSQNFTLKSHQKDAIARTLFGDNTLLAHVVGAGKTFEMAASAMESKRLGLCTKSMIVVPNHLLEQWGNEFYSLYPSAKLLVATKKDLTPERRKEFCSRIATGDYDAVIISHSQFEKIPISKEREEEMINKEINEVTDFLTDVKELGSKAAPSIKALEKTKAKLEEKLKKLMDVERDDTVTFEQLGIDRLYVDESHSYKNLAFYSKMQVAGLNKSDAKKSTDMYNKCMYLDEITNGKGIIFASGTPISNSMTELYTNMKYLQNRRLKELGLINFDAWASTFGETQTAMEIAPEGKGYQAKTRFAKFFNLPELMSIFKESADIKTKDMLNLDVPQNVNFETIECPRSEFQKQMIDEISNRASAVRNRLVDPSEDNMLKITSDGRKLALDQRIMNPLLPDDPNSKSSLCVQKAFEIWENTKEQKSTQLIFCDASTPGDGAWNEDTKYDFNIYDDIKRKLMAKGVPADEIKFIHEASSDAQKNELFTKVRKGEVRFLLGSTAKMGAGTNVQTKLVALHHLDVPWRPSDIEQREGRIIRQGNENEKINVFKYVTADTFDTYSWQTIENKQKFISQIMTSKSPMRSADDMDEQALDYAEIKALCTSNPLIKEKMDLDVSVSRLKLLKANHTSNIHELQDKIRKTLPTRIDILSNSLEKTKEDLDTYNLAKADMHEKHKAIVKAEVIEGLDFSKGENLEDIAEPFAIKIGRTEYEDKTEAGAALIELCRNIKTPDMEVKIGEYCGLDLNVKFDSLKRTFKLSLIGKNHYDLDLSDSGLGNILRIRNRAEKIKDDIDTISITLDNTKKELEIAKVEVEKPFAKQEEYDTKLARLTEVNLILEQQASNENLDSDEIDITKLAEELNEFSKEFDLYSYMDEVSDEEECINSIINDLKNGNYDGIKEFLNNIIDSEADDEEQTKAEELLTKIEKIESKTQFLSFTKESMQEDLADKKTSNLTLPKLEQKKDFSL